MNTEFITHLIHPTFGCCLIVKNGIGTPYFTRKMTDGTVAFAPRKAIAWAFYDCDVLVNAISEGAEYFIAESSLVASEVEPRTAKVNTGEVYSGEGITVALADGRALRIMIPSD